MKNIFFFDGAKNKSAKMNSPHCQSLEEMRMLRSPCATCPVQCAPTTTITSTTTVTTTIVDPCNGCIFSPQKCADGRPLSMWCAYCLRQRLYPEYAREAMCPRVQQPSLCVRASSLPPQCAFNDEYGARDVQSL